MKRVLHTTLALLLIAVLFVGMAPTAQAAEAMNVEIPIVINVQGSNPVAGAYAHFKLTPVTENAPVPTDGTDYYMDLTSIGENNVVINFTIPNMGVYKYTLKMVGGTYYHPEDATLYYIDVYNLADGSTEWSDSVEIHKGQTGSEDYKFDQLNYTIPLMDINVAKKWVDQDSIRPSSIEVELLLNGERPTVLINHGAVTAGYENLVMNKSYNWQRKWEGVDARCATYSVKEVKVPAGYVATYKYADGVYTITNTGALIQTGQLNWPIPVLCGAGCLFLLAGLLMLRRKEEENA